MAALEIDSHIKVGGDGPTTTFVSGFCDIDLLAIRPILAALPSFLHLKSDQKRTRAFEASLTLLADEISNPEIGSEIVIIHLFQMLFVHAIRAHAEKATPNQVGWFKAVQDRQLGEAIRAMHQQIPRGTC